MKAKGQFYSLIFSVFRKVFFFFFFFFFFVLYLKVKICFSSVSLLLKQFSSHSREMCPFL